VLEGDHMAFTVGDLAKLTGITVRTLHHYDEIGLVVPSQRTAAGYRLYDDEDVIRLQQVLLFRELGLPLDEIAFAIDEAGTREELLRKHREVLVAKRSRIDSMLSALDSALGALEKGHAMQPDDVKQMFEGFDPSQYDEEVKERWGDTDAYKESMRRTKKYGKAEWDQIQKNWGQIYGDIAALMTAGTAVSDPAVQALVEAHRAHIDRWFYPCNKEMHKGLGAMYVADARFAANLDKVAPGFAQYLSDAIAAS
jgi:MerR family transcriptional regulator, thiopeptide resistance regulator